jgi:hypothetical protein
LGVEEIWAEEVIRMLMLTYVDDQRPVHERITADEIRKVIEGFKTMNWWP